MLRVSLASLGLAALLAAPSALAQDVDPARLDLAAVTPTSRTLDVLVTGDAPQSLGTITEAVALDGGVLTVVAHADVPQAGDPRTDSTRLAWPSLTPLSDHFEAGDEVGEAAYADGGVAGSFGKPGAALPFSFDLATPRYPAAALPFIVQALPFEDGLTVTVPTFSAKERFREATLTVEGREDAERPDGSTVSAWVVRQVGGSGIAGQFPQRHLVDPETRQILRTTFEVQGMRIALVPTTPEAQAARAAEAAAARAAATSLRPGSDALATDALRSSESDLVVRVVQPVQQDAGTVTRNVVVDEAAGTVTMTTETVIAMAGQHQQATYVAAYPTLAPLSLREDDGEDVKELAFAEGRVTGTDEGRAIDVAIDAPVFVNAWQPVLVTLLPFAEGYSAVLHGYSTADGVVETLLTVTGQEDVSGRTAWVVTAQREGNPTLTFRVDAETRELLTYGLSPQPGVQIEFAPAAE